MAWAIAGWFVLAASAYGVAWLAGWTALTDGRPLILIVAAPYWLAVIFVYNRRDSRRRESEPL